jgi:Zn-dependent M16 (insulinase) family peptidase
MPTPAQAARPHRQSHGFLLSAPIAIPELQATAIHAVHEETGFRALCLEADDPENLLAVCVPTMPVDNTGVPHIAEHVVLGGSRAYPLHDPFVELLKCSMATFANAMTYADRTVFPVASNVPEDFRNLARVYLDAVFHPLLRRESFAQEGHLLVPEEQGLRHQGIVYSEMRGAYAELDTVAQNGVLAELFADTPYQYDAGGLPEAVAKLSYEEFLAYCAEHYRPNRALGFCYGGLGTDVWLELLAEALAGLPAGQPATPPLPPGTVPRWTSPRTHVLPVAIGPDEEPEDRSGVVLAWRLGDQSDLAATLAGDLLDHLLLGNSSSPLRKALTDSELGDDLFLAGHDSERFEAVFQVGLRGSQPGEHGQFEELVLDTLAQVASEGFPATVVLGALNQMEFSRRLIDDQYALTLAEAVFGSWVYGLDPLQVLCLEAPLQRLREQALGDPGFVPGLIREKLLDNPHRLLLVCTPDPDLADRQRDEIEQDLAATHDSLSLAERARLEEEAARLREWQEQPDASDDLARLPRLSRDRIPAHPLPVDVQTRDVGDGLLLANHAFTGGLEECLHAFELPDLPADLVDLLPLFAYCLGRLDTATHGYAELAERIALLGAHIRGGYSLCSRSPSAVARPVPILTLRCNCLGSELGNALDVVWEILASTRFVASTRLQELLRQRRSRLLASVLSDAHVVAAHQASAGLSAAHDVRSRWYGPAQLRLADRLVGGLPDSLERVAADLARLQGNLLRAGAGVLACTGAASGNPVASAYLSRFPASVHPDTPSPEFPEFRPHTTQMALNVPAQGAYVACCFPAVRLEDPVAPLLDVGAHLLSLGDAWDAVRAQGGAYGASCDYDPMFGSLSFLSYRDPTPERTLGVFLNLARQPHVWERRLIEEAMPAVARQDHHPLRPSYLTRQTLYHHLHGISYAMRETYRRRLLDATPEGVASALARTFARAEAAVSRCVIGDAALLSPLAGAPGWECAPLLG